MCDYSLVFIKKDGSKEKVMESVELVTKKGFILYCQEYIWRGKENIRGFYYL